MWFASNDVAFLLKPELPAAYFLAGNRYQSQAVFVTFGGFPPLSVSSDGFA